MIFFIFFEELDRFILWYNKKIQLQLSFQENILKI